MQSMCDYFAYGLRLSSEWAFPILPACSDKPPDAIIRLGSLDRYIATPVASEGLINASRLTALLFWKDTGSLLIRAGREIVIDPAEHAENKAIEEAVLGPALSVLLHQRGRLVVHASAVTLGGNAVAFVGNSGYGKSTLAWAFYAAGHPLIADDICALDAERAAPVVFPAYPQINLWPKALAPVSQDASTLEPPEKSAEKRSFPAQERFSLRCRSLRRIYVLRAGTRAKIELLSRRETLAEFLRYSYHDTEFGASDDSAHLLRCAKLANAVKARRLTLPPRIDELPKMVSLVEDDIGI